MSNTPEHSIGPLRRCPPYYIGETYRGRNTAHPEAERWPDGRQTGKRDKLARRMIRKAFGRSLSRIEQHVLKARDARNEVQRLATNSHEAARYWDKVLALHVPLGQPATRAQIRDKFRPYYAHTTEQAQRVERAERAAKAAENAKMLSTVKSLDEAMKQLHEDIVIAIVKRGGEEVHRLIAKQA